MRVNSNQIDWSKIQTKIVSPFEMNEILDEYGIDTLIAGKNGGNPLENNLAIYNQKNALLRVFKNCKMFYLVRREPVKIEYKPGKFYQSMEIRPHIYRVANNNQNEIPDGINPCDIFVKFRALFKEEYGVSFSSAFGQSRVVNFKDTIPKQIDYGMPSFDIYMHVYKADVSSAYGYELSKKLPTVKDMLIIDGFEKPSKKYPFAYYPGLGVSVYDEFELDINSSDKTYLLKESPYSLKPIIDKIYKLKEDATDPQERLFYKSVLNISIGYFQKNDNPVYAYIAAIVKARCNHRMEVLEKRILDAGNEVILINTDSISWDGSDMPEIYTEEKGLGNFIIEHKDIKACVKGPKCYQLYDNGETITVYSGLPKRFSERLNFGAILSMDRDLEAAKWNPDTLRYDFETINSFYQKRGVKTWKTQK